MSYYLNPNIAGITETIALNDGDGITVRWATAFPTTRTNKIAYHIYFSETERTIFSEGPKFVVLTYTNQATITGFTPGTVYYFAVRAVEYTENVLDTSALVPYQDDLLLLPTTILSSDIDEVQTTIPIIDGTDFPAFGVVLAGTELIRYGSVTGNSLTLAERGYNGTTATIHNTDGYNGELTWSPTLTFFIGEEERNPRVYHAQCRIDIDHYPYTVTDGYKQVVKDILTVDLTSSDQYNVGFQPYDYAGWHRTDPVQLLNGECVGSYIGGEQYCADGYNGVGQTLRGMSVQEQNNQRQEMLLSIDGEPVVLLTKQRTGYRCKCFLPSNESPDDRCTKCFGTGFVVGWQQYFNPRRSDSRIFVKFSPAEDAVKSTETGFESEAIFDVWTLTVPTIKNRDIIIRFDQDGNEEFRYEVLSVTRNRLLQSLMGGQKFRVQRIRKTDPAYQIRSFRNTELLPSKIFTTLAQAPSILPHRHVIVINEDTFGIEDVNQITGMAQGHSHSVVDGIVQEALGHTHEVILP